MGQERYIKSEEDNAVMKVDFLNPSSLEFRLDSYMRLNLHNKTTKEIMEDVDLKLMFPLTHRTGYLEIFNGAEEFGVIRDLKELSPKSQKVIEEVLEQRYFVPEITQIRKVIFIQGQGMISLLRKTRSLSGTSIPTATLSGTSQS